MKKLAPIFFLMLCMPTLARAEDGYCADACCPPDAAYSSDQSSSGEPGSSSTHAEEILSAEDRENCSGCVDTRGATPPTLDDCGTKASGTFYCAPGMCCDWADSSMQKCECNTKADSVGDCDESKENGESKCQTCMCLAEAGGEPAGACVAGVICSMKNRKKAAAAGTTLCDVVHGATTKGGRQYTAAKCICDRYGTGSDPGIDNGATQYNQSYCNCCTGTANEDAVKKCKDADRVDCDQAPYKTITHYNTGKKDPNNPTGPRIASPPNANCTTVTLPGNPSCGHFFYSCP